MSDLEVKIATDKCTKNHHGTTELAVRQIRRGSDETYAVRCYTEDGLVSVTYSYVVEYDRWELICKEQHSTVEMTPNGLACKNDISKTSLETIAEDHL